MFNMTFLSTAMPLPPMENKNGKYLKIEGKYLKYRDHGLMCVYVF